MMDQNTNTGEKKSEKRTENDRKQKRIQGRDRKKAFHAHSIKEHVPEWWGIITVEEDDGRLDFYFYREPADNPKLDINRKISILWRPELAHIQELNGMPKYRDKSKLFVANKIVETVAYETLSPQISEELFQRDYTKIEETLNEFRKERTVKKRRRRR